MFSLDFWHYRPIYKIASLFPVIIIHYGWVIILTTIYGSQAKQHQDVVINKITAEKQHNHIKIQCSFSEENIIDALAAGTLDIQVNIKSKEAVSNDVYIKNIDTLSKNSLLLSIQPLLKDAIYGIEKRKITVQFTTASGVTKVSRTVALGTTTQRLDLRAYSTLNPSKYILNGILLLLGFSAVFILAVPALRKYNFKRHHIKKYKELTAEDKTKQDPFTFEDLEEKDEVIVIDDKIMLLRSWKRLRALKEEDRMEELRGFFDEGEKSNLFKPQTEAERKINRMWFGMTGACTGWLLYILFMNFNLESYQAALSYLFDSASTQFSSVIYTDSLLAIALGIGIGIAFLVADRIYDNYSVSITKILYRFTLRILILTGCFAVQFLINIYLINNNFFGSLITWICIGAGLVLSSGIYKAKKKTLIAIGITALTGFVIYRLFSLKIFIDVLSGEGILLISLLCTGSILGILTYSQPIIQQETIEEENTATADHHEALAVQAGEL